ncbi:hypothetical protein UFOVP496_34 [uncultured Caudovirales phage]|uniref:Uncharacterized protein n=1 Tax=uncultured Caudovirales phage TaxID=2100421 RepID=A0A6J5MI96_9CAUD|nr:hypothetical protein UFOVP496_34 [uncultured Caudovirales phage]
MTLITRAVGIHPTLGVVRAAAITRSHREHAHAHDSLRDALRARGASRIWVGSGTPVADSEAGAREIESVQTRGFATPLRERESRRPL